MDLADPGAIATLAERLGVDLTVVGPELPISVSVADRFAQDGRLLLGPTAAAARLETSKAFAKAFMERHGIPTARFHTAESAEDALAVVRSGSFGFPVVLKADGLAAGKGVVIAPDLREAEEAVHAAMTAGRFGRAGERLVIEECLQGPEVSYACSFVLSDGSRALPLGVRRRTTIASMMMTSDQTPAAWARSPQAHSLTSGSLHARVVMREVVDPGHRGDGGRGNPFKGFLYVGLMLTATGPRVIEFNVRLGDPEAQVILPRIAPSR